MSWAGRPAETPVTGPRFPHQDRQAAETDTSPFLVVLCILTIGVPLAALAWLILGSGAAMPQRALEGSSSLPSWLLLIEPGSFVNMLVALFLVCASGSGALMLATLAGRESNRLRRAGYALQAGALVTGRVVARVSGLATFVIAALFLTSAGVAVLVPGNEDAAQGSEHSDHAPLPVETLTPSEPPAPVADNGPIFAASATTAEREASVRGLAEQTMQFFPAETVEVDYVGAPGMEISRGICGGATRTGDHYFVGHGFTVDAAGVDMDGIAALWREEGLNIGTTASSIMGDGLRSDTIETASLSYETDGTFWLFITGRCGDIP